jgi:hypothetical protein
VVTAAPRGGWYLDAQRQERTGSAAVPLGGRHLGVQ